MKRVAGGLRRLAGAVAGLARGDGRRGAIILMYHCIAGPEEERWVAPGVRWPVRAFERQVRFLKRRRRVISMTELEESIRGGRVPPSGTVAITFDDGYLDTFTRAAPILAEAGLPATVYLPTRYIEGARGQWLDELWAAFGRRTGSTLETERGRRSLSDARAAAAAMSELAGALLVAGPEERERLLSQARASLKPDADPPRLTMTWDEVGELVRRYPLMELGGHSVGHTDLRTWKGREAAEEIAGCARAIEARTGRRPRHFSYPYGRWCEETRGMVREAGFTSAVGAGPEPRIGPWSDPMALPRIEGHVGPMGLASLTGWAHPIGRLVHRG